MTYVGTDVLCCHLCVVLERKFIAPGFPTKTHDAVIISSMPVTCLAHLTVLHLLTYLLTYLLTPLSRVVLEKLTILELVKKFLSFYGTRRFITAFTSARHLSLS